MPTPSQLSFFDFATLYDSLSRNGNPLESLAAHVPWAEFCPRMVSLLVSKKHCLFNADEFIEWTGLFS